MKKQDKYLVYNSQHSFTKLKDIDEFKELSLDYVQKTDWFFFTFNKLQTVNPQTNENKVLKPKVLDCCWSFQWTNYIYKGKYTEEKDSLDTKNKKKLLQKIETLLMIISTSLKKKKKKKKNKRQVKILIKRNRLKTNKRWCE